MTVVIDPESPLADLATSFARSLRGERKSVHTIEVYLRAILEFDRYAVAHKFPREVAKIRRPHIEGFLESQLEKNSPATASVRHAGLRRFLRWCQDEGEVPTSPMERIKAPKVPETLPTVLTDDQVEAIVRECEGTTFRQRRDQALVLFMLDTGTRRAEAAGVMLADLDLEQCTAKVTGKGNVPRVVIFSDRTCAAIDRYIRSSRRKHRSVGSPALWLGSNGALTAEGVASVIVRRATRASIMLPDGRPIHVHLLRHRFADNALRNGVSEGDLMTLGGWKSPQVMRSYGRGNRTERAHASMRKVFEAV